MSIKKTLLAAAAVLGLVMQAPAAHAHTAILSAPIVSIAAVAAPDTANVVDSGETQLGLSLLAASSVAHVVTAVTAYAITTTAAEETVLGDGSILATNDLGAPETAVVAEDEEPIVETAALELAAETVALADLDQMVGAQGVPLSMLTEQSLTAVNSGNQITATQVGSGQIQLDANAFAGFGGIGNFVINSGHNNNLQSSMSVNIVIAQ